MLVHAYYPSIPEMGTRESEVQGHLVIWLHTKFKASLRSPIPPPPKKKSNEANSSRSRGRECYAVLTFVSILETVVLPSLEDNDIV